MQVTNLRLLAAAVVLGLSAFACGPDAVTPDPTPTPDNAAPDLMAVTPPQIHADFSGQVTLRGASFTSATEVLAGGTPIAIPAITVSVVSDTEIHLNISYAGNPLVSGPVDLTVRTEYGTSQMQPLEIRPVLGDVEHLITAPRGFSTNAGAFDVWTRPLDSDGEFIGTNHTLAAQGLDWSHFQLTDLMVTNTADDSNVFPDLFGVADVVFQPRGEETAVAVALTIDQSGSLIGLGSNPVPSDPDDKRIDGAQMFVDSMGSKDQATVIKFQCPCPGGSQIVQELTSDKDVLKTALDGLRDTEGGNTPLYEAIDLSLETLNAAEGMAARAVVVLTDGRNTVDGPTPDELITKALDFEIPVFVVGLGNPNDPLSLDRDELERISETTGGRFFFAEDADALGDIFVALTALLEDSYRLEAAVTFDPPLPGAGVYEVTGTITTRVEGREVSFDLEPFTVSVLN